MKAFLPFIWKWKGTSKDKIGRRGGKGQGRSLERRIKWKEQKIKIKQTIWALVKIQLCNKSGFVGKLSQLIYTSSVSLLSGMGKTETGRSCQQASRMFFFPDSWCCPRTSGGQRGATTSVGWRLKGPCCSAVDALADEPVDCMNIRKPARDVKDAARMREKGFSSSGDVARATHALAVTSRADWTDHLFLHCFFCIGWGEMLFLFLTCFLLMLCHSINSLWYPSTQSRDQTTMTHTKH